MAMPTAGRSPYFTQLESRMLFKVICSSVVSAIPHLMKKSPDSGIINRVSLEYFSACEEHQSDCTQKGITGQLKGNIV
jgi:hypothetical protein